jgi:hypothetical protein
MLVPLTRREVECLIAWRGTPFWPDEERVRRRLQSALASGRPLCLSRLQARILYGWLEDRLGGHRGGGAVMNLEEAAIADKLKQALADGEAPSGR